MRPVWRELTRRKVVLCDREMDELDGLSDHEVALVRFFRRANILAHHHAGVCGPFSRNTPYSTVAELREVHDSYARQATQLRAAAEYLRNTPLPSVILDLIRASGEPDMPLRRRWVPDRFHADNIQKAAEFCERVATAASRMAAEDHVQIVDRDYGKVSAVVCARWRRRRSGCLVRRCTARWRELHL